MAPDGLLELVFHYRDPFLFRFDGEPFAAQPRSAAVSQTRRSVEFRPAGPAGLLTVRFQPWGAWNFLRAPLSELSDRQIETEALWGADARELEERLGDALGDGARIALVERFLLARLSRHGKPDVEPLVRHVWRDCGRSSVAELRRELGVGERRLERLFADALGTSPKGFARLTRFLHACRLLRSHSHDRLVDVALACGYHDQSHFTNDFRAFAGVAPGRFRAGAEFSLLELD